MCVRIVLAALLVAAAVASPTAAAVRPVVRVAVSGAGYARAVTVRVTLPRGSKPVRRAVVRASATMTAPGHFMRVAPVRLSERAPGVYRGGLRFVMLGQWTIRVDVRARSTRPATSRLTIKL